MQKIRSVTNLANARW